MVGDSTLYFLCVGVVENLSKILRRQQKHNKDNTLQNRAEQYSAVQYSAVQSRTVQYSTVQYNAIQ